MDFLTDTKIPVGPAMKSVVDWLTTNAAGFFDGLAAFLEAVIGALLAFLQVASPVIAVGVLAITAALFIARSQPVNARRIGLAGSLLVIVGVIDVATGLDLLTWKALGPANIEDFMPLLMIALTAGLAYALHRSIGLVIFVVLSLLFIVNQGYWKETTETLALVLASAVVCMAIGVPLGIAAARRPWLAAAMRPVLDLMQTIPTFVYLIPALILFGLGMVPGLIATVIFALPAPIRLTQLGIASTPVSLVEAAESFGATPWQRLAKVEIPFAMPQILAGLTQTIMLSLSMVVIAALVGADGLGVPVLRALNSVNIAMGFNAGLTIVLIAIILDRLCRIDAKGGRP